MLEGATASYNASVVVTSIPTFAAAGIVLLARPVPPEAVAAGRTAEAAG